MKTAIKKLEELPNAKYPNNIPVGMIIEVYTINKIIPVVGERFGAIDGWSTSIVSEIIDDHTFKTQNSIYYWESLKPGETINPNHPDLGRGIDTEKTQQHPVYLVLSESEKAKGFIRPVRNSYVHKVCGVRTTMGNSIAETYARDPKFYGATYCCGCNKHLPVSEFLWDGTNEEVGS